MRRILLSMVLLIGIVPAAEAQFTIKAGLSFARTTESALIPDIETRTGFAAGLSVGIPLGGVVQLRPELFFVQKGGKFSSGDELEINELDIPALLQVNVPLPALAPYVFAGPQAEYELSCTVADVDCVDTNSLRWGFTGGAGVKLGGAFSIEGRYGWTLDEISDDLGAKPRTIKLLAGLSFGG